MAKIVLFVLFVIRPPPRPTLFPYTTLFRSGIVMRLRMFLLLITFLKASHSFRNRLQEGDKRSEERFSRNAETELVCRLLLEKKNKSNVEYGTYVDYKHAKAAHARHNRAIPCIIT